MIFLVRTLFFSTLIQASIGWAEVRFEGASLWLRARTISAGQQVWSLQSYFEKSRTRFGPSGRVEPLGQGLARAVTWGQILENETSAEGRTEMNSYMNALGAKEGDIAATATYEVEREDAGFHLNWAYGLMRKWMIGFDVPLIHRRTRVSTNVNVRPAYGVRRTDMAQKVRQASEQQLVNSGYDDIPEDHASWDWGDIDLISQELLAETYHWSWAIQELVRFPTAQNSDLDSYIHEQDDAGQVDLGLTNVVDYRMGAWLFGAKAGYVMQMPDTVRSRVSPTSDSRRVDPKVSRDLGDWYWGALDGDYRVSRDLNFALEYSYLRKFRDKYSGRSEDGVDYARFGRDSEQELHRTRANLRYRIRSDGSRDGVENKWTVGLGYTYPWVGRNATNVSQTSLDIVRYF